MFESYIKDGIISAEDLNDLINGDEAAPVKLIDATFVLPTSRQNPYKNFTRAHITGTQFYDIKANANPDSPIPNTLPTPPDFARDINSMGLSNDDFIVIYGQDGMVMGPARLWWMFRIFGHDQVCVLDGGLPAWRAAGYDVTAEQTEKPTYSKNFRTNFRDDLLENIDNIKALCATPCHTKRVLDARPPERFNGHMAEPRENMRSGHIPNSINIPAKSLVDPKTGKLKSKTELQKIFETQDILQCDCLIASCGSGITACMIALALYHLGRDDIAVYDGSWSEWGCTHAGTAVNFGCGP
jgi:thiosulfate/3-mercaptopyruvate sulfurtransferase